MTSKAIDKLRDPEYRQAFVASQINFGIPFQIRAMLKARPGWTQQTLAERTDMLQPRISGLMTPGKTRPNIETLRRVAEAFDCGLVVRFAPFSELLRWSENFDPESFNVKSFDAELPELEQDVQVARLTAAISGQCNIEALAPAQKTEVSFINSNPQWQGSTESRTKPMDIAYTITGTEQEWKQSVAKESVSR
jgi:transcriptional regulator with XRE-family HTH domain